MNYRYTLNSQPLTDYLIISSGISSAVTVDIHYEADSDTHSHNVKMQTQRSALN